MRERLVYEAVNADAGLCSCPIGQHVPAREWRAASVADDTHDCSGAWPACGVRTLGPGRAGERSSGCLLLWDDTAPCGKPPNKKQGGRRARWRRACSVLCDCRALATAGAPGTGKNPVQRDAPEPTPDLLAIFRACERGEVQRWGVRCASGYACTTCPSAHPLDIMMMQCSSSSLW